MLETRSDLFGAVPHLGSNALTPHVLIDEDTPQFSAGVPVQVSDFITLGSMCGDLCLVALNAGAELYAGEIFLCAHSLTPPNREYER